MNSESSCRDESVADADPTSVAERDPGEQSGSDPGVDEALKRIRENARAVRDRQVETALARLDGRDDVSEAERAAVERLADRLVARLISVPERALREGEAADGESVDDETVETAVELFG
jgi:glutamyl-tRNA reductase